jgi:hypothetical protein
MATSSCQGFRQYVTCHYITKIIMLHGTSIIFGSGQIAAGALPAVDIERRLAGGVTAAGVVQRAKTAAGN